MSKETDGRRNRYQVRAALPERTGRGRAVGVVLALLAGEDQLGIELPCLPG